MAFGISIYIFSDDELSYEQHRLETFYVDKVDSCKITKIDKEHSSNGKGDYFIFYTDCSYSYPCLFELNNNFILSNDLKLGMTVIKDSNSLNLTLIDNNKTYHLKLLDPKILEYRGLRIKILLIWFSIIIVIVLITPNSSFVKK
jgi:hypothetical protein